MGSTPMSRKGLRGQTSLVPTFPAEDIQLYRAWVSPSGRVRRGFDFFQTEERLHLNPPFPREIEECRRYWTDTDAAFFRDPDLPSV